MQRIPSEKTVSYSSLSSSPRVGLCFSRVRFFFRSGTVRVGGGVPTCSRAAAFTAFTARNAFVFFRFGKRLSSRFGAEFRRLGCNQLG
jgi:hypothetical protein